MPAAWTQPRAKGQDGAREDAMPEMKLGMFFWPAGHHLAAWRHPEAIADAGEKLAHIVEVAKLAERGLFDMFFMADSVSFWRGDLDSMVRDNYGAKIEPFTLMAALSQHTRHLGLVCTATTTYDQPYLLARRFASLDLVSAGRAGWNLVTSANRAEAACFGIAQHMAKDDRYGRAREFAYIVRGLWNSFGEGAFPRDKESGLYIDRERLDILDFDGKFLSARGPLNVPPSPQGEPVMVQAGASDDGRELAAETAEVIFAAHQTLADAMAFYADVKGRMAAYGRDPDSLKIMPGLMVYVGRTRDEAEEKFETMQDLIDDKTGIEFLENRMDYDFSQCDPDAPPPDIEFDNISASRGALFLDIARRENLTLRGLWRRVAGARGHMQIVGSPTEIADFMEEWVSEKACDGFNVMPPLFPHDLSDFIELVTPELQRRGLFRRAYEGTTLRANLGLTRPPLPSRRVDAADAAAE
jgi:FMN-dependent oxidoreductase (nitrilotriacetate monooxygenase family)